MDHSKFFRFETDNFEKIKNLSFHQSLISRSNLPKSLKELVLYRWFPWTTHLFQLPVASMHLRFKSRAWFLFMRSFMVFKLTTWMKSVLDCTFEKLFYFLNRAFWGGLATLHFENFHVFNRRSSSLRARFFSVRQTIFMKELTLVILKIPKLSISAWKKCWNHRFESTRSENMASIRACFFKLMISSFFPQRIWKLWHR